MKAIAVYPKKPNSVHLREIPRPAVEDVPDGKGVLVKVLRVGVDATDREINEGLYGNPPPGDDFLVLGHEVFGKVQAVGPGVRRIRAGDYVTATVRRPGKSLYDQIGTYDMTSEETYYERGINLLHGFLTEYFVDHEDYIVRVPPGLQHLHVLMEPMSCAAKAVQQAYEVQRRMRVWSPQRAFVLGAGQIGLLATAILRLRGLEVYTIARRKPPTVSSKIVADLEATYVSLSETSVDELVSKVGRPDIILDATGSSQMALDAMRHLALNGVLVWTSITGGDEQVTLPGDRINLQWVLGNKLLLGSVNANREHFELGIRDLALAEAMYPGVLQQILTNPVTGLDQYEEMMRLLVEDRSALKVYVEVASD
ncbi:MAG: glucose dehydrogenase [Pirellulaceae bacterium]|nr:MAG: glucose dehydrogenase [Pirellulaceae bacterium]